MNKFILCCCMLFLTAAQCLVADNAATDRIHWLTSYSEAVKEAQATKKPIVAFFTGSDWCGWCTKLEQEALNTPEFADATAGRFTFLKLDFPMHTPIDPAIKAQNKELQKKYEVRGYPTIVLLDGEGRKIGTTGYRPGGGKSFADHLFKLVDEHSSYQQKLSQLDDSTFNGSELKRLYEQARSYHLYNDASRLVRLGLQSDAALFFLTEEYRDKVVSGKIHDADTLKLRETLLAADPLNTHQIHYKVAVIDFEAYNDGNEDEDVDATAAVEPLKNYINKFGKTDKEHLWRLELIIAQVYLDQDELKKALDYAQASYQSAPLGAKPEIDLAIRNIQAQLR